jgi:hypothetical protein
MVAWQHGSIAALEHTKDSAPRCVLAATATLHVVGRPADFFGCLGFRLAGDELFGLAGNTRAASFHLLINMQSGCTAELPTCHTPPNRIKLLQCLRSAAFCRNLHAIIDHMTAPDPITWMRRRMKGTLEPIPRLVHPIMPAKGGLGCRTKLLVCCINTSVAVAGSPFSSY